MKIAIITDSFLPGVGGTENAVRYLAEELCKTNDVLVCAPHFKGEDDSVFPFEVVRTASFPVTSNDVCALPNVSPKFKKRLNEFCPDVLHCQSVSGMTSYALSYGKKHNVPVIMTLHTKFREAFGNSMPIKFVVDAMVRDIAVKASKADCVCTVCNSMADELHSYGYKGNVTVIRNGVAISKLQNLQQNKQLAYDKYALTSADDILLYVGHLVKLKNLQFTLDALRKVRESKPNVKLLMVGSGLDDKYFHNYVTTHNLADNVIFTGQIRDKQLLSSIYSIADLFVFPSVFDNDPLTVVEAACHRTPSITLAGTGSSERITDGVDGFVCNNDVDTFADRITYLLNNKDVLVSAGINAEKNIPTDWKDTADAYYKIYQQLVATGKAEN